MTDTLNFIASDYLQRNHIHPDGCYTGFQVREIVDAHLADFPDRATYLAMTNLARDLISEKRASEIRIRDLEFQIARELEVVKKLATLLDQARDRINELHSNARKGFKS